MRTRKENGFTLFELMIVIAIISVLASVAVPAFMVWLPRWRVKSAATDLFSNLQLAKISAIREGTTCRVTYSPGQYILSYPDTPGAPEFKTVILADYGSGVQFLGNDDVSTYTSAQVNFNKRGLTDQTGDAIVYLTNVKKDVYYRVVLTPAAVIKLQKQSGASWQ